MSLASNTHEFACRLVWTGAAKGGTTNYETYSRECRVDFTGKPSLRGTSAQTKRQANSWVFEARLMRGLLYGMAAAGTADDSSPSRSIARESRRRKSQKPSAAKRLSSAIMLQGIQAMRFEASSSAPPTSGPSDQPNELKRP